MRRDQIYLQHILHNIANIQRLAERGWEVFSRDEDMQAATLHYLQTLAESSSRLSEPAKANHPEIDWTAIRGFRNRIVHEYLAVDLQMVWTIIQNELPRLQESVAIMVTEAETRADDEGDQHDENDR